jgi:CRISPR/Cas system CSM-associated protein Csm3 (group 7 of RAMP superfamily)
LTHVPDGPNYSCNRRLSELASQARGRELSGQRAYRESCAVCQVFGNAAQAGHLRVEDAYPDEAVRVEQRMGIAVDRVYGSVAEGPYGYEVVTGGRFVTRLVVQNFTLAQLGLLALALRDLADGRLALGYGKSRGLGRVRVEAGPLALRYPGCTVSDGTMRTLTGENVGAADQVYGVGSFLDTSGYGFPAPDQAPLPGGATGVDDGWGAVQAEVAADALPALWQACVARWAERVGATAEAS